MTDRDSRFWHPFANMGAVRSSELVIERGEDVWVWAEDGTRYLDATAALWYANVGHGRPEIAKAIADQLGRIESYSTVAWDSPDALRAEIDRLGPDRVATFFAEPVIGAGGVYPPPPGYLEEVAAICRDTGVLLVAECVITAFGRLGEWFGPERFGVRPDMIVFAKGVTSGYLPLGGVVASGQVAEPFWSSADAPWFRHGPTYAGHATCCAAALANLDLLESEHLIPRGAELEAPLLDALAPLAEHPLVGEVRGGTGLLAAVALSPEVLEREPGAPVALTKFAREAGVFLRPLGAGAAASPPLTATVEHIGQIADAFRHGLDRLADSLPAPDTELTEAAV